MSNYALLIEDMLFSFSRVNSFKQCHYAWLKQYILEEERLSGYYGEYGGFMHHILEKYFKNELEIFELAGYYKEHYHENVISIPPPKPVDLAEKYYNEGLNFLENFEFDLDKYEVIGVEKELSFTIGKFKFIGYIDLLLRDKGTGEIIIYDYKSSDPFKKAKSPDKKKIQEYSFQQYLYCYGLYKELNQYPSEFRLWFFRLDKVVRIKFDIGEMNNAVKWAEDEINEIMAEEDFKPLSNFWFCNYLCSVSKGCPFKGDR